MKNLYLIPTDKPSRLYKTGNFLLLDSKAMPNNTLETKNQNIYITSDEKIKEGEYQLFNPLGNFDNAKVSKAERLLQNDGRRKKIILTTDQDLIKDGVQPIDDEFLNWFVKNPSCEEINSITEYKDGYGNWFEYNKEFWDKHNNKPKFGTKHKIIIPKEEPKQETLEEAAERLSELQEGTYTPQHKITYKHGFTDGAKSQAAKEYWFEQFKKNKL